VQFNKFVHEKISDEGRIVRQYDCCYIEKKGMVVRIIKVKFIKKVIIFFNFEYVFGIFFLIFEQKHVLKHQVGILRFYVLLKFEA